MLPVGNASPMTGSAIAGIGGWLILPAFALALAPFLTGWQVYLDFRFLDSNNLSAELRAVCFIEMFILTQMVLFEAYVAIAFFRRQKSAPKLVICLLIVRAVASLMGESLRIADFQFGSWIVAAVWIPYFLISRRVKATFVFGPTAVTSNSASRRSQERCDDLSQVASDAPASEPRTFVEECAPPAESRNKYCHGKSTQGHARQPLGSP